MVKSFLLAFLIIFAVAGICEFIYILKMLFYFPNFRVQNYSLIILNSGSAVKQLNFIWQKIRWYGDAFAAGIIAITDGIDEHELLECEKFSGGKNIILCTAAAISDCKQLQGS